MADSFSFNMRVATAARDSGKGASVVLATVPNKPETVLAPDRASSVTLSLAREVAAKLGYNKTVKVTVELVD